LYTCFDIENGERVQLVCAIAFVVLENDGITIVKNK